MLYFVPYSSTKFAVEAINEGLQNELKQFKIDNVGLVVGAHPTEMNNGAKSGINADREDVIATYGNVAKDALEKIGSVIGGNMHRNNPQRLADIIFEIITMKNGTRPLSVPVDVISDGADIEFLKSVKPLKEKWMRKYYSEEGL